MVHPVRTPFGAAGAVARASLDAARHPLRTVGDVVAAGRGLVVSVVTGHHPEAASGGDGGSSAEPVAHPAEPRQRHGDPLATEPGPAGSAPTEPGPVRSEPVEQVKPAGSTAAESAPAGSAPAEPGPVGSVPATPGPAEPGPAEPAHEQVVTEPSAVTARGDADEIPSPAVQPDEEDVEVTTPVGTTGAGPGSNPDTTESDLQQPGTEPLMDPATTKRVKREAETLRRASERRKD